MRSPESEEQRSRRSYEYVLVRLGLLFLGVGGGVLVLAKADDLADLLNPPRITIYTEIKPTPSPSPTQRINLEPTPRGVPVR